MAAGGRCSQSGYRQVTCAVRSTARPRVGGRPLKNRPSPPHLERIGNRRANCPPREVEILPTVLYPQDPVWRDPRVSGRYGKGGRTLWSVEATVGLVACRRCVCDAAFWGLDRAFKPATGGLARPHGARRLCTRSTMCECVWGACICMAAMECGGRRFTVCRLVAAAAVRSPACSARGRGGFAGEPGWLANLVTRPLRVSARAYPQSCQGRLLLDLGRVDLAGGMGALRKSV